jgi:aryl-alcohol dehydrogenase-like predicted oxidoreductase
MEEKCNKVNRRNFLKTIGAAGLGSVLASNASAEPNEPNAPQQGQSPQVPKRKLGRTDTEVSALCLGAIEITDHQAVLHACAKWGVNYWDTASGYTGGNSELAIGKFLKANPEMRKKIVIATKASNASSVEEVEQRLRTSLERMNTDYVDVFYGVHVLDDISQLKEELKPWAENAKKQGLIKYFGFSTHKNMPANLAAAAKLGWVDAILTTHNFRLTKSAEMQKAIDLCHKAGVALTAMKTQKSVTVATEKDRMLIEHFTSKGFTEGQAKIKAVLEDERFASVSVGMTSVALVTENVAAALDKTKLTADDKDVLAWYAQATCSGYCAGCGYICDAAAPDVPCISDIMRSLMYHNSYGNKELARQAFAEIPADVKAKLLTTDYRLAEARCPQRMPIAKLVAQAVAQLA